MKMLGMDDKREQEVVKYFVLAPEQDYTVGQETRRLRQEIRLNPTY